MRPVLRHGVRRGLYWAGALLGARLAVSLGMFLGDGFWHLTH